MENNKLKLMIIMGTRPEIIRLSEIIKKCDKYFDLILVHTGQNYDYELNQVFFEDLGLRQPDHFLNVVGNDLGETMGNVLAKSYKIMKELSPDAVLVLGDTNSCLSIVSAKRLHIPIFHLEAGNRCFDENLPEEINRRIIDHTSDVNICYSEHARRNLINEGRPIDKTFVLGSPMAEVLNVNIHKINKSNILEKLGLEPKKYILLSAHREENIDNEKNFLNLMNSVNAMAEKYNMPVIYSTHPRSAKFIEKRNFKFHPLVRQLKPFGFSDYNNLQLNAFCVVSDSGTLPEESSYFHTFPAVCIRTSTERPEALDKGNFVLAGITTKEVLQAVDVAVKTNEDGFKGIDVPVYTEDISNKVVNLVQSYTGIINKMVWKKD